MDYDGVIVLGYGLDNGKIHDIAKKRVDRFIEIYKQKKSQAIFSGGYSLKIKKGVGPTEASAMKDYAIKQGVNEKDIILEEESRDTHANAYFTKKIAEKLGWKRILIITTDLHIYKARYFFEFIYGPKYHFDFIGVENSLGEEECQSRIKYENKSVQIMEKIYKEQGINPGEDAKIKVLIDNFYAGKDNGFDPKKIVKVEE